MAAVEHELKCIYPALPSTQRGAMIVLGEERRPADKRSFESFLYCNSKNVYIRDIEKADRCDIFEEHTTKVKVAKYNKNGNFIASGDSSGKVLVWATDNREIKANVLEVLGGPVQDISWSPEIDKNSFSIAVGGASNGVRSRVVTMTCNNKGTLSSEQKAVNGIAYRPVRKFRVVTASEDMCLNFYDGPPFKHAKTITDHSNFVNCVRYSPKGDCFISGGADGTALIYEGETAERIGELVDKNVKSMDKKPKAHNGGIYGVCFNDDGSEFITVSGDKSIKLWNVESRELLGEFNMGKQVKDMQVGCLFQGQHIITVSVSGFINFLDRTQPSNGKGEHTPLRVYKGHNQPITCMAVSQDYTKLYTGSAELVAKEKNALIIEWDLSSGTAEDIKGQGHTSTVADLTVVGNTIISISVDDTVRFTDRSSLTYSDVYKLPSQPRAVNGNQDLTVVACQKHLVVMDKSRNITFQADIKYEPYAMTMQAIEGTDDVLVAIAGQFDDKVYIYKVQGSSLTEIKVLDLKDDIIDLKFSPNGKLLAAGSGKMRSVYLFNTSDFELIYKEQKHAAKIFTIGWSPNGNFFASGALDGNVAIWRNTKVGYSNYIHFMKGVHVKATVKKLCWLADDTIATCSDDCNIKQFTLKNLPNDVSNISQSMQQTQLH